MSESDKNEGHKAGLAEFEHLIVHHTELPSTALSDLLDGATNIVGKLFSWFWLLVVGVIVYSVISRYAFAQGSVMLEEVQWHIAGAVWLVGLAYTLVSDDHVRVDVLHERFSLKTQAWIEFLGILLLLLPFLVIAFIEALPYFWSSYQQGEVSPAPNGLPGRWVLKFFLPACFALLFVAGLSRMFRCTALLFGIPQPRRANSNSGNGQQ